MFTSIPHPQRAPQSSLFDQIACICQQCIGHELYHFQLVFVVICVNDDYNAERHEITNLQQFPSPPSYLLCLLNSYQVFTLLLQRTLTAVPYLIFQWRLVLGGIVLGACFHFPDYGLSLVTGKIHCIKLSCICVFNQQLVC